MSLDTTQLQVLIRSGSPQQQAWASKVLPIRKNGHLLLMYVAGQFSPFEPRLTLSIVTSTLLIANMLVSSLCFRVLLRAR